MATIRRGSWGVDVHKAQALLTRRGFDCGAIDGIFGTKTDVAVKAFQKAKGLVVDGIVGPKTWAALELVSGSDMPTLRSEIPRMKGEDVKAFQWLVTQQGFDCGPIDGVYGNKAIAACKAFQRANGLTADGVCGPKTWDALDTGEESWVRRLIAWGFEEMIALKGLTYAVKQYQAAMGLAADGVVGAKTLATLGGEVIVARIPEAEMKCQCNEYCNGYPAGAGISAGVRLLAERIFREVERAYPGTAFYISNRRAPPPDGALAGGFRCTKWNKKRGGAAGSRHLKGDGMDVYGKCPGVADGVIRNRIEAVALELNTRGGVGYGARYIVHIDTRGVKARWRY